jgi:tetratricopeptide (TPR) repeat protein/predicted aspartyl protease
VAVAVVALVWALPFAAEAGCRIKSLELPVKIVGSRAVATVGINGTPAPMIVDSGGFYSLLTLPAALQLHLPLSSSGVHLAGMTGQFYAQRTVVDKLGLLRNDIDDVEFLVVGGGEPGAGTMGAIGRNILSMADTEYDLAHGAIRFVFPNDDCANANMAYWADTLPVSEVDLMSDLDTTVPAIRARARLNGSEVKAVFDTGASTRVSAQAARFAGVAEADLKTDAQAYGLGVMKGTDSWTAPFDKFELGTEVIRHPRLSVTDFDIQGVDMLLGLDFFLSHRIYVSKKQSKMFFTYNGGPVFALDKNPTGSTVAAEGDVPAEATRNFTAEELARRGAVLALVRDYEHALADLDQACEREPTSAAFFAQRGAIQQALNHPAEAAADFDRALALDPMEFDARVARADLRLSAEDRDGAKADLDLLDKALVPEAQQRIAMSHLYVSLDQPAQALAQLNQWLPAHKHDTRRAYALNNRCWYRALLGVELDRALEDCDAAVDSDSKHSAYLDSRGWVYLRLGKYKKAVSDFDDSIENNPSSASSLYGRGLAKTRLGNAAEGSADLVAARKAQPDIDQKVPLNESMAEAAAKP